MSLDDLIEHEANKSYWLQKSLASACQTIAGQSELIKVLSWDHPGSYGLPTKSPEILSDQEFKGYPKIPRFNAESFTITEKIDGTNACVVIRDDGTMFCQSRNTIITPGKKTDNHGFAAWAEDNKESLLKLGVGYHYGEWWGKGINRGYNTNEKRFSLFAWWLPVEEIPECCTTVPIVANHITDAIERIKSEGSILAPGYMLPEGLIMSSKQYHNVRYKVIINEGK